MGLQFEERIPWLGNPMTSKLCPPTTYGQTTRISHKVSWWGFNLKRGSHSLGNPRLQNCVPPRHMAKATKFLRRWPGNRCSAGDSEGSQNPSVFFNDLRKVAYIRKINYQTIFCKSSCWRKENEKLNSGKARWERLHEIKINRELHRWLHEIKKRKELDRWGEDLQSLNTVGIMTVSKSKLPVKIKSKTHGFNLL